MTTLPSLSGPDPGPPASAILSQLPSSAVTASSSRSQSLSLIGRTAGTMMSTAPFAMLVILGGWARVTFRIVGWIENGLTPLRVSSRLSSFSISKGPQGWSQECDPRGKAMRAREARTYRTDPAGSAETSSLTCTTLFTSGLGAPFASPPKIGSGERKASWSLVSAGTYECASMMYAGWMELGGGREGMERAEVIKEVRGGGFEGGMMAMGWGCWTRDD